MALGMALGMAPVATNREKYGSALFPFHVVAADADPFGEEKHAAVEKATRHEQR